MQKISDNYSFLLLLTFLMVFRIIEYFDQAIVMNEKMTDDIKK